jgi:hypothetical protein
VIPRMFANVAQGNLTAQEATAEAQKEVATIVEKWNQLEASTAKR